MKTPPPNNKKKLIGLFKPEKRFSLAMAYLVSLSPHPKAYSSLGKFPIRDTRIPTDQSLLVSRTTVGRCCCAWQGNILVNQGLEQKGEFFFFFFVTKEHP